MQRGEAPLLVLQLKDEGVPQIQIPPPFFQEGGQGDGEKEFFSTLLVGSEEIWVAARSWALRLGF